MGFIKIDTLKKKELQLFLKRKNLPTSGNRPELLQRIIDNLGVDEIDASLIFDEDDNEDIDVIRMDVSNLTKTIQDLSLQFAQLMTHFNSDRSATTSAPPASKSSTATSGFVEEQSPSHSSSAHTSSATPHDRPEHPQNAILTNSTTGDMQTLIPEFNPSDELSPSAEQYVDRVNTLITMHNWNTKSVLFTTQAKMRGPAKLWSDSLLGMLHSWEEFARRLIEDFGKTECEADIHFRMVANVRKPGERVIEYFYRMRALGQRHQLTDAAIVSYIRHGMNHTDLQSAVATIQFANLNELRCTIERFIANKPTISAKPRPIIRSPPTFTPPNRNTQRYQPPTSSVVCFNCSEQGHISVNCTKPQRKPRCTICKRTNHLEAECPQRIKVPDVTRDNVMKIANGNAENENRSKFVIIENHLIEAFIDPGSDRSLIQYSTANEIGIIEQCEPFTLTGFGGGEWVGDSHINALLQIDGMKIKHRFLIVKDEFLTYPLLLGNDIVCQEGLRLVVEKESCRIETIDRVKTGSELSVVDSNKLYKLINECSSCFGETLDRLGVCKTTEMNITLTSKTPIAKRPYRVPFAKREIIDNIIANLSKHDIIRPSTSSYSSPVVLVKKSNGEERMCVDFRALNAITEKKPYPMPTVEEILSMVAGKSLFTILDLMSGYYQIPIEEKCREFTAFVTHAGQHEFNRMPFGLVNAPCVFHEAISKLVKPMKGRAFSYVDEIIIPSNTVEEGLRNLREFLQLVSEAGFTIRISKCMFLATEITFLGHRLTKEGIKPSHEKTNAIANFPQPSNITELRRFIGLTSFFRKFVPGFAVIAKPLTSMFKKENIKTPFPWGLEQTKAFDELKQILCNEPLLQIYDPGKLHEVHTDASTIGLAGILFQAADENADRKPVFYFSRACTAAESKYSSYELEVLAVVETLERFRMYLLGRKFNVVTDCSAVSAIKETSPLIPRIARWWLRLQEYDFSIVHRGASRMAHVDALSRSPAERGQDSDTVASLVMRVSIAQNDWIACMQRQDPRLAVIVETLQGRNGTEGNVQLRQQFCVKDSRLFRKDEGKYKLVVPSAVRWRIVKHFHDDMGHFGVEKVLQRIKENLWFRRMRSFVKSYISSCIECCYHKKVPGAAEGRMYIVDVTPIPFRTIHVDHVGPFPRSQRGKGYIIGVADAFSKYIVVKAVRDVKTRPVIEMLNDLTTYFGLPDVIISDRGSAFTSREFETFCQNNEIRHIRTAVRTPRANGQIERLNQSILQFLRTSNSEQSKWDLELRQLQWSINTQRNSTTGYSPNDIIFDFKLKDIGVNHFVQAVHDEAEDLEPVNMQQRRAEVSRRIHEEKEKWKIRFDAKHRQPVTYNEGDLVVVESVPSPTGDSHKLEPKYRGPYIVEKCLRQDRYVLGEIETGRKRRNFSTVMTSDKLKPWCLLGPELDDAGEEADDDDDVEPRTTPGQEGPSCHSNTVTGGNEVARPVRVHRRGHNMEN